MKNLPYLLILSFLFSLNHAQAQDESSSKVRVLAYGGIGFGNVKNDNQPNYNLNNNTGEVLINYSWNDKLGLATGIGFNELSGNGFNSMGDFYHERIVLRLPLLLTIKTDVTEDFRVFGNLGFYGQSIIKDEYRFLSNVQEDTYEGWNFGAQLGIGFTYKLNPGIYGGIHYQGQSDLSAFETSSNAGISDEQKLENLNSIGLLFMFEF